MAVGYVLINVAPGKEHEVYLAVKNMPVSYTHLTLPTTPYV